MFDSLSNFKKFIESKKYEKMNQKFVHLIQNINFLQIQNRDKISNEIKLKVYQSPFITIDFYTNPAGKYFIICFCEYLIIFDKINQEILENILESRNKMSKLYILSELNSEFPEKINSIMPKQNKIKRKKLQKEVSNFSKQFKLFQYRSEFDELFKMILPCLSCYLIKKSYLKYKNDRLFYLKNYQTIINEKINEKKETFSIDEFITLREIGSGSMSFIYLCYHIQREQLFAMKIQQIRNKDLFQRELNFYQNIRHPMIPRFYGTIQVQKDFYMVIEYIKGKTLDDIHCVFSIKQKIIMDLLNVFDFLHQNNYIYRDLKPNNVIIDKNNNITLIDFDRIIKNDIKRKEDEYTKNFMHKFIAPELTELNQIPLFKSDIYSIGQMIHYILFETAEIEINEKYIPDIYYLYKRAVDIDKDKRPTIKELINEMKCALETTKKNIQYYLTNINIIISNNDKNELLKSIYFYNLNQNYNALEFLKMVLLLRKDSKNIQFVLSIITISAEIKNFAPSQFLLGVFYYEGVNVKHDLNISFYYLNLALKQNCAAAQNYLGYIYYKGKHVKRDINKSIYYYTLAANQNYTLAQSNLGFLFSEGRLIKRDINKAIYYYTLAAIKNVVPEEIVLGSPYVKCDIQKAIKFLTLAANQNSLYAQNRLGLIYYSIDIKKSIYYFTLAANQNYSLAQYNLGVILSNKNINEYNINKAIYYLTKASNNNIIKAQYCLGVIYNDQRHIHPDIYKSIYYYTLAANKNYAPAQNNLGYIYSHDNTIPRNIDKAIHFYTLAANQNHVYAQNNLGLLYLEGNGIKRDISKAIYYLSQAASQNYSISLYHLGRIYFEGIDVNRDLNKAVHYFTRAADHDESRAQLLLGLYNININNIKKGVNYILMSSKNRNIFAHFYVGFLYHQGKYVEQDINKAIHFYKEASSFNDKMAKNNLGILYKNGFDDKFTSNISLSIEYFKEAIQKKDPLAMYNLSNIYIYYEQDLNKAIELLIKSLNLGFNQSIILLCFVLAKKYGCNIITIRKEINAQKDISKSLKEQLIKIIMVEKLYIKTIFDIKYNWYKNLDVLYDLNHLHIMSTQIKNKDSSLNKANHPPNISSEFYIGFGITI